MPRAATTSDAFNAVAEPRRREILSYLALRERPVGDIVATLRIDQPSVSKHLRVLRSVGLVRMRCEGRHKYYRTNAEAIRPLHEWAGNFERYWHAPIAGRQEARRGTKAARKDEPIEFRIRRHQCLSRLKGEAMIQAPRSIEDLT